MSLPPGFLDELRARLSIAQVVGRKVIWDTRKSNPSKGDLWAPCPFHQEKTASFHVEDRKGYYYCFGCQAKGDAISFVRETENVSFMEAVEILAREAGMPMPARDPGAQQKADRRSLLADVMEQAVHYFRLQLKTGAAAAARTYLSDKRRLNENVWERWELGFAPDAWQGLWDHLKAKGVEDELILAAGLAKPSRKGGKPYDTFRGRIMFPIRDARGRCIAFGGRSLDPGEQAKYLNSPETELFDKGRTLFNHGPARAASGKGKPLIVAEGYMDVIALSEHGFSAAVAPLGTAVTETQLQMLWRMAPEPIMALDGDAAGVRAAMRVMDLALPLLEAGQSLRFVLMPEGQDPDDLLKAGGAAAFDARLSEAVPMVQLLWDRETSAQNFDSPERKAALDKALREKLRLIRDPSIRQHYAAAIKDLRWQLFNPRGQKSNVPWRGRAAPATANPATKATALARLSDEVQLERMRQEVILAVLVLWPDLASEFEVHLEKLECRDAELSRLCGLILMYWSDGAQVLREKISGELGSDRVENLMSARHVAIVPCIRRPDDKDAARFTLESEFAKLDATRGLAAEVRDAEEDLDGEADEGLTWRLSQAASAAQIAARNAKEDTAEYEIGENGAAVDRDEKAAFEALIRKITIDRAER